MEEKIRHVFFLMLENRSFDHFLGCIPGVDGINPSSPYENRDPNGAIYAHHAAAPDKTPFDPGHGYQSVLRQIDGGGLGPMGGFVLDYAAVHQGRPVSLDQVMAYFNRGKVPILHSLAEHFAVCDRWFSPVPGPTWTNRFFALSGTSNGWVSMPSRRHMKLELDKYDQPTIFDRLSERAIPWRVYFGDVPQSWALKRLRSWENLQRYRYLRLFEEDLASAESENLPEFIFIEPHYFWPGKTDQHPPHSVKDGDDLIGRVYNAIRGNEAIWESSLLIITYDEHGGFYDHVVPPDPAPAPDESNHEGFAFDRLGVRVPAVLVSKWIKPGVLRPSGQALMDHTSVIRYLSGKHGFAPLGERAAAAFDIGDAISSSPVHSAPGPFKLAGARSFLDHDADKPDQELSESQEALVELTKVVEEEMGVTPAEAGLRAARAEASVPDRVEVAKERVKDALERAHLLLPAGEKRER